MDKIKKVIGCEDEIAGPELCEGCTGKYYNSPQCKENRKGGGYSLLYQNEV